MKLYNFSCAKYQHNIGTAIIMLDNMGREDKANEVRKVCNRVDLFTYGALCPMPYKDWKYLMTVANWAIARGSGAWYD